MITLMLYYFSSIFVSFRMIPKYSLAAALCTSVIASLVLDVFEADLTDRFYYVPIGAILAISVLDGLRSEAAEDVAEEPAVASPEPPPRPRPRAAIGAAR
jgi:hypothetical protein